MKMLAALTLIVLFVVPFSGCINDGSGNFVFHAGDGTVDYTNRPAPSYTQEFYNETKHALIYKVKFASRDAFIYALLAIPKQGNNHPAFVLLPAQSIKKEGEQKWLGNKLNSLGFVTLSLDQRGHGETGGTVPGMDKETEAFAAGKEITQLKMVHDALAGYDILRSLPEVDPFEIYMAGESMGGRFAIIATAIEPNIRGLLLISTAGYGRPEFEDDKMQEFIEAVDPDYYIASISPRKILMIHGKDDWVIGEDMARRTFDFAKEPKRFVLEEGRFHGYYHVSDTRLPETLENELAWLTS